jgi:hypothetical protein
MFSVTEKITKLVICFGRYLFCTITSIGMLMLFYNNHAYAGTWSNVDNANIELKECTKKFSGTIDKGDLTSEFTNLIGGRVCLDSPGGSLSEVYDFIQLLQEANGFGAGGDDALTIATRVQTGDKCESACAILFMFGTSSYRTSYPDRILEPGAKLGFHSPFIDPRLGDKYSGDEAFSGAIQISSLLAASTYKTSTPAGVLPVELLSIVLGTKPNEMYYVDTCAEMNILEIQTPGEYDCYQREVVTVENSEPAVVLAARRMCASSHVVRYRRWFTNQAYQFSDIVDFSTSIAKEETELLDWEISGLSPNLTIKIALNNIEYVVPNWMTNAAFQFCRVELSGKITGNSIVLSSPHVEFGSMLDYDGVAGEKNYDNSVQAFGLAPLDTPYN